MQTRVGVHTGKVVVRSIRTDDLHTDYDPVGNTIHIASAHAEAQACFLRAIAAAPGVL